MAREDYISREKVLEKFCVYVGGGMSMDDYDALYDIVAKMPSIQPKTKQWISVKDSLPEDEQNVLVCSDKGNIEVSWGYHTREKESRFIWCIGGWKFGTVIAWMPLPPSYQGESEG